MTDYTELKRLLEGCKESSCADEADFGRRIAELYDHLDPETVSEMVADNERLHTKLEQARVIGRISYNFDAYEKVLEERDQLKAENEVLRKALGDCADELSAEVICKHSGQKLEDMHPVTRRLYERDMASVIEARAAMGKGGQS